MKIGYFSILTILLISMFGCQANSQEKSRTNQTNQKNVAASAAKSVPLKLKLNREEMGTTADTSKLTDTLEKVFNDREKNGVFREGTNEVEKSVFLTADRSVSIEEIAELVAVLKDAGASPVLIPVPVKVTRPRPNPLVLYVYVGSGDHAPPVNEVKEIDLDGAERERDETENDIKGVEISFTGESSDGILVAVSKDETYTMDGQQISAGDLKTAIENRLKSKDKSEKTIAVQAENYGNIVDIAKIADSAGAGKVFFIKKQ